MVGNHKSAAAFGIGLIGDLPAKMLNDALNDAQPQTTAIDAIHIATLKALEQLWQ